MSEMSKYKAERVLELEGDYNVKALNKAYRKLAMKWHPDTAAAKGEDAKKAEAMMAQVNAAKDYLDGIFRTTGRIILTCDAAEAPSATEVDDRFAEAVRNAQAAAAQREAGARRRAQAEAAEAERKRRREEMAREAREKADERYAAYSSGNGGRTAGDGIVEILKRIFSFDIVFRVVFLLFALNMMGSATGDGEYLFWATVMLVGCVNMVFPLVTTPIRKAVLTLLGLFPTAGRR